MKTIIARIRRVVNSTMVTTALDVSVTEGTSAEPILSSVSPPSAIESESKPKGELETIVEPVPVRPRSRNAKGGRGRAKRQRPAR